MPVRSAGSDNRDATFKPRAPLRITVRFVKISQTEVSSILNLYESVMSYACHGLFYREGEALADQLAELCKEAGDVLDCAKKILKARGWVEEVIFSGDEARVRGSIEVVEDSEAETCHRLRGIISRLYSLRDRKPRRFVEVECCSTGKPECVFRPEVS